MIQLYVEINGQWVWVMKCESMTAIVASARRRAGRGQRCKIDVPVGRVRP